MSLSCLANSQTIMRILIKSNLFSPKVQCTASVSDPSAQECVPGNMRRRISQESDTEKGGGSGNKDEISVQKPRNEG